MIEKTHAELEKWHYAAVMGDVAYASQGLEEVRLEETMMSFPILMPSAEKQEAKPDPEWVVSQWDIIQQLRGEIAHLHKEIAELGKGQKVNKYTIS